MTEPVMYVVPQDLHERPELAPLVELGIQPGQHIAWYGERDWDVVDSPDITAAAEFALRMLTPAASDPQPVFRPVRVAVGETASLERIARAERLPDPADHLELARHHRREAARLLGR